MVEIRKDIPIPPAEPNFYWRKGKPSFAKVEGMEVGDSIVHPYDEYDFTLHARLKASAIRYGKRNGQEFETRKLDDGIGIWRVS